MTKSYDLSEKSYNQINNGRIQALKSLEQMEGVVHPDLLGYLKKGLELVNSGLEEIHEQDHEHWEEMQDHVEEVAKEVGISNSMWSADEVDLRSEYPHMTVDTVVYRHHWGSLPVEVEVDGNRWADLWIAADKAIRESGDDHHVFVEKFEPTGNPNEVELFTGS